MIRKSFVIEVKPDMLTEYVHRHNPIWKDLEEALQAAVCNYSIFHRPATNELFGYFEVKDEAVFKELETHPICLEWWSYMTEVLVCETEFSLKGKEEELAEIFHLKEGLGYED